MFKDLVILVIISYYKAPDQIKLTKVCLEKQTGLQTGIFIP